MGIHLQCPACGAPASNTSSPDARWGMLYDDSELDRAIEEVHDNGYETFTFTPKEGSITFECPCKRALWVAGRDSDGRWFTLAVAPDHQSEGSMK